MGMKNAPLGRGAKKPPEGGNQKGGSTPPLELLSCPPLTAHWRYSTDVGGAAY